MFLAPLPGRDEEDVEILALFGENITPAAAVAIGLRAEYVFLDHFLEPFREDIESDSEALLEVAEALLAVNGFAHEQQGPPVAHDPKRARAANSEERREGEGGVRTGRPGWETY